MFDDVALFKMSLDAGGGSTKGIINLVNVENPQGQEHVRPFVEFSCVKDTHGNIKKAAFQKNSKVKSDIEMIIHRRAVILKFNTRNIVQV